MNEIEALLNKVSLQWSFPKLAVQHGRPTRVPLACDFSFQLSKLKTEWQDIPKDLAKFWEYCVEAKLFVDVTYGQWGLEIYSTKAAVLQTNNYRLDRPTDCATGDLIVGHFIGDQDLLMVRTDRNSLDYGEVIVISPLDPRAEWYKAANTFKDFLKIYCQSEGAKFWEPS